MVLYCNSKKEKNAFVDEFLGGDRLQKAKIALSVGLSPDFRSGIQNQRNLFCSLFLDGKEFSCEEDASRGCSFSGGILYVLFWMRDS